MAKVDKFGKVARSVARWHLGCHFSESKKSVVRRERADKR